MSCSSHELMNSQACAGIDELCDFCGTEKENYVHLFLLHL